MATPQVPEFWPMALGASADTVEIPDTTPAGEGIPSFTSLFPVLTQIDPTAGGVFIQRTWMNGLFQLLGNNIWYLQHGGLFPWNAAFEYPVGAHVLGSNNNEYVALQSSTGQDPTQDSTGGTWQNVTTFLGTAFLPLSGGTMTGALTLKGDPTASLQAATKQYVDKKGTSMPVGSVYVQFSGQSAPSDLFGGTWSNISNSYAGLFFRAEGGAAAAFGGTQSDGAPDITGTWTSGMFNAIWSSTGAFYKSANRGKESNSNNSGTIAGFAASRSNRKYGSADEVRPVNSTIRIWKRTA